jgi:hypothetical protein
MIRARQDMIERFAQETSPQFSLGINIGRAGVRYAAQSLGPGTLREQSGWLMHEGTIAVQSLITSITPEASFRALSAARFGVETAISEEMVRTEERQAA